MRICLMLFGLFFALAVTGCGGQQIAAEKTPAVAAQESKPEKRTEFIRNMYKREKAEFADACRVIKTLLDHTDQEESFSSVRKNLIEKKVIPSDWTYTRTSPVTKGMVSSMLCNALNIKGGITMRILGNTQRYALRECVWIGIVLEGTVDEYVSGGELLAIFARAEIFQKHGDIRSIQ